MEAVILILIALGLIFFFGGAVGLLRFPDFYTRLHAAGKLDTLGTLCLALALALANLDHFSLAEIIVSLKITAIVVFMFLASPTATHAIVDAGLRAGLSPWTNQRAEPPREAGRS